VCFLNEHFPKVDSGRRRAFQEAAWRDNCVVDSGMMHVDARAGGSGALTWHDVLAPDRLSPPAAVADGGASVALKWSPLQPHKWFGAAASYDLQWRPADDASLWQTASATISGCQCVKKVRRRCCHHCRRSLMVC
jgi:hypothetical protein